MPPSFGNMSDARILAVFIQALPPMTRLDAVITFLTRRIGIGNPPTPTQGATCRKNLRAINTLFISITLISSSLLSNAKMHNLKAMPHEAMSTLRTMEHEAVSTLRTIEQEAMSTLKTIEHDAISNIKAMPVPLKHSATRPEIPNGGYGWVCVASQVLINAFTWGTVAVSLQHGSQAWGESQTDTESTSRPTAST